MSYELFMQLVRALLSVRQNRITPTEFVEIVAALVDQSEESPYGTETNISGNVTGPVLSGNIKGSVTFR